jgi:hypothetical protein
MSTEQTARITFNQDILPARFTGGKFNPVLKSNASDFGAVADALINRNVMSGKRASIASTATNGTELLRMMKD